VDHIGDEGRSHSKEEPIKPIWMRVSLSTSMVGFMTNRLAKGLQNLGVKKGDRVAIYLPMIPELVGAALAVARLGAAHMVVF